MTRARSELHDEYDGLLRAGFYNHSMSSGGIGRMCDIGSEGHFDRYVQSQRALEHYDEIKAAADPECPVCKGFGYLPRFTNAPYADTCSCTIDKRRGPEITFSGRTLEQE